MICYLNLYLGSLNTNLRSRSLRYFQDLDTTFNIFNCLDILSENLNEYLIRSLKQNFICCVGLKGMTEQDEILSELESMTADQKLKLAL